MSRMSPPLDGTLSSGTPSIGSWCPLGIEGYLVHENLRNCQPLGPYSRVMPRALRWSWEGGALSHERGTPVLNRNPGEEQADGGQRAKRGPRSFSVGVQFDVCESAANLRRSRALFSRTCKPNVNPVLAAGAQPTDLQLSHPPCFIAPTRDTPHDHQYVQAPLPSLLPILRPDSSPIRRRCRQNGSADRYRGTSLIRNSPPP
jgi:hypothetical protein